LRGDFVNRWFEKVLSHRQTRHPWVWVATAGVLLVALAGAPRLVAQAYPAAAHSAIPAAHAGAGQAADDATVPPARLTPNFAEFGEQRTEKILMTVLQLALILAIAKVGGWVFEMFKIPGVLGELAGGILIGPYLLGSILQVYVGGHWHPLFPSPVGLTSWPLSDVLWTIAVLASIVLLFVTGLHTDLRQFMANLGPASVCAVGGVVVPYVLGAWTVTIFVPGTTFFSPEAMFMGAIMVATSVGITARVLSDIRRLDTPEGVTILGAAVVDDVLGILVLAIVVGIVKAERAGSAIDLAGILITTGKALGVWIGVTAVVLGLAPLLERLIEGVKYQGARAGLALALAMAGAGIAEMFGLAFIIGAYSVGLGLSRTKMAEKLREDLVGVNDFIVPVFFAAMGMLVNFGAMRQALAFGAVITLWAILGKIIGCGLPALGWFNFRGAARIGVGMLPRGEVALIVAGVGLSSQLIDQKIFGVSIMMTLITTVIAPIGLVPLFKGRPGRRGQTAWPSEQRALESEKPIVIEMPGTIARQFVRLLLVVLEEKGFAPSYSDPEAGVYQMVKHGQVASLREVEGRVTLEATPAVEADIRAAVKLAEARLVSAVQQIHEVPGGQGGKPPGSPC
jgi:Kef-type K+ transport system membrane component KefB